jgi:hypothetical protein
VKLVYFHSFEIRHSLENIYFVVKHYVLKTLRRTISGTGVSWGATAQYLGWGLLLSSGG